jgi:hypothetical protein
MTISTKYEKQIKEVINDLVYVRKTPFVISYTYEESSLRCLFEPMKQELRVNDYGIYSEQNKMGPSVNVFFEDILKISFLHNYFEKTTEDTFALYPKCNCA